MKFFIILAIFLTISVHTILSQDDNGGQNDPAENPGTDDSAPASDDVNGNSDSGESPDDGNTGEGANGEAGEEETPGGASDTTDDNTPETSNNDTTPETDDSDTNSTDTTGGDNNTTMTDAMRVANTISKLPAKCKSRYDACYGKDSKVDDIKNTDLSKVDDDDICEMIEDGEDCVTETKNGMMCTEDEYEKVRVVACSACRSAILSLVLIGVLSLVSKILSQH